MEMSSTGYYWGQTNACCCMTSEGEERLRTQVLHIFGRLFSISVVMELVALLVHVQGP